MKALVLTVLDDVTALYKFRSLKQLLSRGDFKLSNKRVQTDRRPTKQYESDSLMAKEVHDTNLILLEFLDIKKYRTFN